jgi:pimeloyl-ACP methyl ester carboxylesterase
MARFLVCHGAWNSAWAWKKMRPLLAAAGHELHVPTYTGCGERSHLVSPLVDLELHIRDVVQVIEFEDLRDLTLVGHSYGGMVATGVADRVRDRIKRLVYLDAFVPRDGQCVLDLMPDVRRRKEEASARKSWLLDPPPIPSDTSPEDADWIKTRRLPQPVRTFTQPLRLNLPESAYAESCPRSYIYCTRITPEDIFGPFAAMARKDSQWRLFEIDATHSPHITAPQALAELLERIVSTD